MDYVYKVLDINLHTYSKYTSNGKSNILNQVQSSICPSPQYAKLNSQA